MVYFPTSPKLFLQYLAKQTNTKTVSFRLMSYDYFIKNVNKHIVHRLSVDTFIPLSRQCDRRTSDGRMDGNKTTAYTALA